jgi:hypothetical protein
MSRRETRCVAARSVYFQSVDSAVVINDAAGLSAFQNSNPGRSFNVWISRAIGLHCIDAGRHGAAAWWLR